MLPQKHGVTEGVKFKEDRTIWGIGYTYGKRNTYENNLELLIEIYRILTKKDISLMVLGGKNSYPNLA